MKKQGVSLDKAGTGDLRAIANSASMREPNAIIAAILQVVEEVTKDRFQVPRASSSPRVGAVQGHSSGSGVNFIPGGTELSWRH